MLFVIGHPQIEWVASPEILAEYREVLRRPKFALPADLLSRWDERFGSAIAVWPVEVTVSFPRDTKDAMFLACAQAADADYLITGDKDFTEALKIGKTKIVSVGQFDEWVSRRLGE